MLVEKCVLDLVVLQQLGYILLFCERADAARTTVNQIRRSRCLVDSLAQLALGGRRARIRSTFRKGRHLCYILFFLGIVFAERVKPLLLLRRLSGGACLSNFF